MLELESPDWDQMLDNVNARLDQMLAAAQARIDGMPEAAPPTIASYDFAACIATHTQGLHDRLRAAETMLHDVEASLQADEAFTDQHARQLASVGRKLADWTGRAIG
jgi:hypothetical protein